MPATSLENGTGFHSAQRVITFMFVWWRPFEKEFTSKKEWSDQYLIAVKVSLLLDPYVVESTSKISFC